MTSQRPRNVRLLTLEQLALTDAETFGEVVEELSARSVVFENHYLQTAGLTGILNGLHMVSARQSHRGCATFVLIDEDDRGLVNLPPFPPGWHTRSVHIPDAKSTFSDLRNVDFVWLHAHVGGAPEFAQCLAVMDALCSHSSVLIVTAVHGKAPNWNSLPFESLLPEPLIRVPLWLTGSGLTTSSVQTLTGSDDIGLTISELLNGRRQRESIDSASPVGPVNLIELAEFPGRPVLRNVCLRNADVVAVRSDDFLYVECDRATEVPEPDRSSRALYAKPADVWNVHDVSGEYHAVVDELRRRLI
ncbi:MAG: hypothetical protein R3C59_07895 [Planctomycetaceae bacterium]